METPATNPWLHAWHDPLANLKTSKSCVRFADLSADGDSKLVICDASKKIKVFRGTSLDQECDLLDIPVALCVIYTELASPRIPSVAVAAGSYIFIYRQMRPYRKWTCPSIEIAEVETQVWSDLKNDSIDIDNAVMRLTNARDAGVILSGRSLDLISDPECSGSVPRTRQEYVQEMKNLPYFQQTLITCMDTLKKDAEDADAISLLVIGTEAAQVMILPQDPSNSSYLCRVNMPSVPTMFLISGLFDVEWRIVVACRDGKLYTIKGGDVRGSAVLTGLAIDVASQVISLAKGNDKLIWVATMDKLLSCYSVKGKRTTSISLGAALSDMCVLTLQRSKLSSVLLVALVTGEIRMYKESKMVHSFSVEKPVIAMRFGSYGREENTLAIVHGKGSLTFKIMKRLAEIGGSNSGFAPVEQDTPLAIPKKTKLYVEQAQRERDSAAQMHASSQKDLCKLRLEIAKAYVKTLGDCPSQGIPASGFPDVRVHATVIGLGPKFIIRVSFQVSGNLPLLQTCLLFSYNADCYSMGHNSSSCQCIGVPVLLPGPKHIFETEILNVDGQGRAGQVLLSLVPASPAGATSTGSGSPVAPILTATVRMPVFVRFFQSINCLFWNVRWLQANLTKTNNQQMAIVGIIVLLCLFMTFGGNSRGVNMNIDPTMLIIICLLLIIVVLLGLNYLKTHNNDGVNSSVEAEVQLLDNSVQQAIPLADIETGTGGNIAKTGFVESSGFQKPGAGGM